MTVLLCVCRVVRRLSAPAFVHGVLVFRTLRARDGSSLDGVPQPPHLVFSGVDPRRKPPHVVLQRGSNYSSVIRRAQALRPSFGKKSFRFREPAGQRLATSRDHTNSRGLVGRINRRSKPTPRRGGARAHRHHRSDGPVLVDSLTLGTPLRGDGSEHARMVAFVVLSIVERRSPASALELPTIEGLTSVTTPAASHSWGPVSRSGVLGHGCDLARVTLWGARGPTV